jgi:hypothetical protein
MARPDSRRGQLLKAFISSGEYRNRFDVFANYSGRPYLVTSLDHLHKKLREDLQLPED